MSQGYVDTNYKAMTAGAAIGVHILVKVASDKAEIAGLADVPVGTLVEQAFADGDVVSVALLSKAGTLKCVAAAAVAQGAKVYCRAAGKVDDVATSSAVLVGVAMEAAGAAGDIIEVMPTLG